jgi:hypothetical protein
MSMITLHSPSDIHDALQRIEQSAMRAQKALAALPRTPLEAMEFLKFEPIGSHPLEDRPLNIIEQVNGPIGRFVRRITLSENISRTHSCSPVSGWSDVQRPRNFAVGGPGMPIEVAG